MFWSFDRIAEAIAIGLGTHFRACRMGSVNANRERPVAKVCFAIRIPSLFLNVSEVFIFRFCFCVAASSWFVQFKFAIDRDAIVDCRLSIAGPCGV